MRTLLAGNCLSQEVPWTTSGCNGLSQSKNWNMKWKNIDLRKQFYQAPMWYHADMPYLLLEEKAGQAGRRIKKEVYVELHEDTSGETFPLRTDLFLLLWLALTHLLSKVELGRKVLSGTQLRNFWADKSTIIHFISRCVVTERFVWLISEAHHKNFFTELYQP